MRKTAEEVAHIVDVDGQLLGFESPMISTAEILLRVGRPARELRRIVAGEEQPLDLLEPIRLSPEELTLFVTKERQAQFVPFARRAACFDRRDSF